MRLHHALPTLLTLTSTATTTTAQNATYTNPILPGWHSDPSCVFVPSLANTTFCTTSSFMSFPGAPIYASQDLVTWRLASHAFSRASQLPELRTATNEQFAGMFASTLRWHDGRFWLITAWINTDVGVPRFVLTSADDAFSDEAWGDAMWVETPGFTIDPDIFFDGDGKVVVASSGAPLKACYLDVKTGKMSEPWALWNGTGAGGAEGPHIFKKDGWYYLLAAEGGTQIGHQASIARSRSLNGTWEASPHGPLVTNKGTNEYFQTVGHADLFQDADENWWGVALATRGGPALYNSSIFPMGRETVLYPVSWPEGEWPVAQQVRGQMSGPLPQVLSNATHGTGPVVGKADEVDFAPGSALPHNFIFWRAPFTADVIQVSPADHPNTLKLASSRANLTADASFNATREGLTAVFRRQEHTFFNFTVDLHSGFGSKEGDELGVTNFLNQDQHVDLGIVYLDTVGCVEPHFRFRAHSVRAAAPKDVIMRVPEAWVAGPIRVRVSSRSESLYAFFAAPADMTKEEMLVAEYSTALLSGDGAGSGGLLGVYTTTNGGEGAFNGYVSRWRYYPVAQKVDYDVVIPVV